MANLTTATRPGSSARRPDTFESGRVCAYAGCATRISRYNRSDFCFTHQPVRYPRLRGVFSEDWTDADDG